MVEAGWLAAVFCSATFAAAGAEIASARSPAPAAGLVVGPTAAGQPEPASIGEIDFGTPETFAPVGRTRVIAFRVASPAVQDTLVPSESADPTVVEIVRPAEVVADSSVGYLRVVALREGLTELRVGGKVVVVRAVGDRGERAAERSQPRIVGPSSGATLWGGFVAGVEFLDDGVREWGECRLLVAGRALAPSSVTGPELGPLRRAVFDIPAGAIPPGVSEFVATVTDKSGRELRSEPVRVRIADPASLQPATYRLTEWQMAPRPGRFERGGVLVGNDVRLKRQVVVNNSADPPVGVIFEVHQAGWYQAIVHAAGEPAGGALPTVGLVIDGANQPATNGRLVDTEWRRTPVGVPVRLEPGWRTVSVRFENDYAAGRGNDRNLRLETLELARVDAGRRHAGSGESEMMGGGAMVEMRAEAPGGTGSDEPAGVEAMAMVGGPEGNAASPLAFADAPDPFGRSYRSVRAAWLRPLHGRVLTGPTEVEGLVWWEDSEKSPAPEVRLLVNGNVVASQRARTPRFVVDPAWLRSGFNVLGLEAERADGATSRAVDQQVRWDGPPGMSGPMADPTYFRRYTLHDGAWDGRLLSKVAHHREARELRKATLEGGEECTLTLPVELTGEVEVVLEGRSERGPAVVRAFLQVAAAAPGEAERALGEVKVGSGRGVLTFGKHAMPRGVKSLLFRVVKPDKGSPLLWPEAVVVSRAGVLGSGGIAGAGKLSGRLTLAYPPAGGSPVDVWGALAVVADGWSASGPARAQVLVDGEPLGVEEDVSRRPGPVTLVLPLRGIAPGERRVSLRLKDADGAERTSEARSVRVLAERPARATPLQRAVLLLNRFGYGPDPAELAAVLTRGEASYLAARLEGEGMDPSDQAAMEAAVVRYPNVRSAGDVGQRALHQALLTGNPVRMRFNFWAQNHFSTWIGKTEPDRKWDEHLAFAELGAAPFESLLLASATSPAMLIYLDQQTSRATNLNENYARELLELHTLGVDGGYTQHDVTALARLLTGWNAQREGDGDGRGGREVRTFTHRFDPKLNDPKGQRILGMSFSKVPAERQYDRVRTGLELVAAHPETAQFIAAKLASHYTTEAPPAALVQAMAAEFRRTAGDLRQVLLVMAGHPTFWEAAAEPRLAQPLDFAMRLHRAAGPASAGGMHGYLRRSRAGVFECPTPDGYPEDDAAYADSNAMIQRWKLARESAGALAGVVPAPLRYGAGEPDAAWAQQVIDVLAVRLLGAPLSDRSNDAAVRFAAEITGSKDERTRELAALVAQLPEANVR